MNRDEKLSRVPGLPPKGKRVNGRVALCPSEPNGGTWIAVNDLGVTHALINWYSMPEHVGRNSVSRGEVVNAACAADFPEASEAALGKLPLTRMNPFRLIGIYPATAMAVEWSWDLKKLTRENHPWKTRQWISSGFDELTAERLRGETFQRAWRQRSAGNLSWLRRLHRSHLPQSGPFSTCMHRGDAATVSYTEVAVSPRQAEMRHHSGSLCTNSTWLQQTLHLRSRGIQRA